MSCGKPGLMGRSGKRAPRQGWSALRSRILVGTWMLVLLAGCATQAPSSAGAGLADGGPRQVPQRHRAAGDICDDSRPPGDPLPPVWPASNPGCKADTDCMEGNNGRCEDMNSFRHCTYDECFADEDCTGPGPCMCSGAFWSDANACLRGNCRTDGDCGPGGFCSPASEGLCPEGAGMVAYYCHTPQDECLDEEDCHGAGLCGYDEELSRWTCQSDLCPLSAILP